MGLLPENSLLPVTANAKMLAQSLKARQQPRTQLTGQGLLDTAAIGLSPVPVIGDALGLAADANRFYNEPESRTPLNFGLAALGLIPFVPPLVSAGLGKFAQSQGKTLAAPSMSGPARNQAGAIVYHGSPHKFDQFDSSKIGTGEGAQAYGHGLYFAESPDVAKTYAGAGRAVDTAKDGYSAIEDRLSELMSRYQDKGKYSEAAALEELLINRSPAKAVQRFADDPKALAEIKRHENKFIPSNLYKVDLPDEAIAKMLDYDAPLSKQPNVLEAIRGQLPEDMIKSFDFNVNGGMSAANAYKNWLWNGGKTEASKAEALRQLGIPGIRYLDGGSRGSGQGTSNYVVFPGNEGLLKILERQ